MQPVKLLNLLSIEHLTLNALRFNSTVKQTTSNKLNIKTEKSAVQCEKSGNQSLNKLVYKVPEYYQHDMYCFYDYEVELKSFRLPQPNPL
ncbi:unnamed protein product [Heterobilharzia americana]|nr:unnamed protein product [Heterobilharzia americana]